MKNNVEVDYGRNSVAPRPYFSLLSSFSLNFSQCKTLEPITQPPARLFIAKDGIRDHGSSPRRAVASTWSNLARPSEVSSPRRAGCFLMKLSDGPSAEGHPLVWSVHPHFRIFSHFLLKHCEILQITWQLVLSNSTWPTKICMSTNNCPRTKLGYDTTPRVCLPP